MDTRCKFGLISKSALADTLGAYPSDSTRTRDDVMASPNQNWQADEDQNQNGQFAPPRDTRLDGSRFDQSTPGQELGHPQPRNQQGRCLLIGCAVIFIGGIFLILCAGFGGYRLYMQQVEKYTSEDPLELPIVEYEDDRLEELERRIAEFEENIESLETNSDESSSATSPEAASEVTESDIASAEDSTPDDSIAEEPEPKVLSLRLTADDINALIAREEKLKNHLFVKIENDRVSGDLSFPLDDILPKGEGRFFNGSATFDIQLNEGELFVGMEDIEVNGEELPSHLVEEFKNQNVAGSVMTDPDARRWLRQFESISVEDDELVIVLKDRQKAEEAAEPVQEAAAAE